MSPRIVAIDPSINGTAAFDGEEYLHVTNPGSTSRPLERLSIIVEAVIDQFIGFDQYGDLNVDAVWIEDYAFSRATHAHAKGELGGVLRWEIARENHIPVVLVKPNSRAMFATGKGNAPKPAVVSAVSARTGIVFPTDDHCDAFVIWCMAREANGFEHPMGVLPKTHLRALEKVLVLE